MLGSRAERTSSRRALHSSHVSSILCLFKPLAGLPLAYGSAADLVSEIVSFEAAGSSAACVRRYLSMNYPVYPIGARLGFFFSRINTQLQYEERVRNAGGGGGGRSAWRADGRGADRCRHCKRST